MPRKAGKDSGQMTAGYCPNCGKVFRLAHRFCGRCGYELDHETDMSEGWDIKDLILDVRYKDVVRTVLFTLTSCVDYRQNVRKNSWVTHLCYYAVNDQRSCQICKHLDGLIVPVSYSFWDYYHPPNHWGCRCSVTSMWEHDLEQKKSRFPGSRLLTPEMVPQLPTLDSQWAFNPGDFAKTNLTEFLKTRLTLFVQYPDLAERACRDALRKLRDFRH